MAHIPFYLRDIFGGRRGKRLVYSEMEEENGGPIYKISVLCHPVLVVPKHSVILPEEQIVTLAPEILDTPLST